MKATVRDALFIIAVFLSTDQAIAERFHINSSTQSDSVFFESEAKLEFIQGKTDYIVGYIDFDPANSSAPLSGYLKVDLRRLRTGIEMRDEHMRDNHLQTDKYPYTEFKLKTVSGLPAQLIDGYSGNCQITGDYTIHGVTHEITSAVEIAYSENPAAGVIEKGLHVTARFDIRLEDYEISRPRFLFVKIAETIKIKVRFTASTAHSPATIE